MGAIAAFHTDTVLDYYHPRERYVYHDESECAYGKRIIQDGNQIPGKGTDPFGNARQRCDECARLA